MSVLIITRSDDNESVGFVEDAIRERGGRSFRFETDLFPTEVRMVARYGAGGAERLTLSSEEGELDLGEVSAVWHRRINVAGRMPREMDPQLRFASVGESRAAAMGLLASLKVFRVDEEQRIRRAEHKPLQLRVAHEVGLQVPRTLVTNDPAAVRDFARACGARGMVTKMLSSFAVYDERGREQVVFTNRVREEDLEDLEGLSLCPMTFQESVPKRLELRATVVGGQVFTASIDSGARARAADDWRREGAAFIEEWEHYRLPTEVEGRLLRLAGEFGLNYGAADFILTPDGRHVFLEINPAGEFFWLEQRPGLPISAALADVLLGRATRR